MILVFIFLAIFAIIALLFFIVSASTLRISIQNLNISNIKENNNLDKNIQKNNKTNTEREIQDNSKNKEKFNIKISLVLLKKFTWIFVNLDKNKLKKIEKTIHLDKIKLKELEQNFNFSKLRDLTELKPKITNLDLSIELGLEDVVITSYLIVFVSIIISNILPFVVEIDNYSNCKYKVKPIYLNKNLYKISLNCIIEEKMVHIINILFNFIKKGRSDKYERASNRRSYDDSNEQFAKYG